MINARYSLIKALLSVGKMFRVRALPSPVILPPRLAVIVPVALPNDVFAYQSWKKFKVAMDGHVRRYLLALRRVTKTYTAVRLRI